MAITTLRLGTKTKKLITLEPPTTHQTMANKATAMIAANHLAVGTTASNGLVATSGRHATNRDIPAVPDRHHRPQR